MLIVLASYYQPLSALVRHTEVQDALALATEQVVEVVHGAAGKHATRRIIATKLAKLETTSLLEPGHDVNMYHTICCDQTWSISRNGVPSS